jgi:hypothetical protein
MFTTIITSLLGGSLGGLLRLVPEVIKFFTDKNERDHEFRMTQLQLDIDKARSAEAIDLVHAQGDIATQTAQIQAYIEAVKGQAQLTGVAFIDALNMLVRPALTYWWMILFTVYKACVFLMAWYSFTNIQTFISVIWTSDDWGVLSMLLSFWFVGRVFDSSHKK